MQHHYRHYLLKSSKCTLKTFVSFPNLRYEPQIRKRKCKWNLKQKQTSRTVYVGAWNEEWKRHLATNSLFKMQPKWGCAGGQVASEIQSHDLSSNPGKLNRFNCVKIAWKEPKYTNERPGMAHLKLLYLVIIFSIALCYT